MACYKIWFLGGYLNPGDDRSRWNDFGKSLQEVFNAVATINDDFRRHYQLAWYERCSKREFLDRWKSEDTVAIILNAHGDLFEERPAPLAYHPVLETPAPRQFLGVRGPTVTSGPNQGQSALRLDPKELPAAFHIRALALLACGAGGDSISDWEQLVCPNAPIVATGGGLEGGDEWGKAATGINAWIWKNSLKCDDFKIASGRWKPFDKAPQHPWEQYKRWSSREKDLGRDPMIVKGKEDMDRRHDAALTSAWGFFRFLEVVGPVRFISKPPQPNRDLECKLTKSSSITRVPGLLGRGRRQGLTGQT